MSTQIRNPFDFSNPVRRSDVLAGRRREVDEAMYYLGQSSGDTSYSLALIGDRASGKTSLLNVLCERARETRLLAAQVALDESIMSSELAFFREVFAALMDASAQLGMFGGQTGAKYLRFIEQIELLNAEPAPGEEPLTFGRIYAVARSEGKDLIPSRVRLGSDFQVLIDEAQATGKDGVAVLVDECDLLGRNRGLLQALRNLLMDLPGLKLVLAGTEAMFPAIEDVFSPVPRQFVRINVSNFEDFRDTQAAIRSRLDTAGLEWARPEPSVAYDIHRVTRGNPYEVMLLSHFAFRHTVDKDAQTPLRLTARALEDVARQLEEQDPALQAAVKQVRALDVEEAQILYRALALGGVDTRLFGLAAEAFRRPIDESHAAEVTRTAREQLRRVETTRFVRLTEDDVVQVSVAEFERLYIRYFILGASGERIPLPELRDPRAVMAKKLETFLQTCFVERYQLPTDDVVVVETRRGSPIRSEVPFAERDLVAEQYSARIDVPIVIASTNWSMTLWVPGLDESTITQREVRAFLHELSTDLSDYLVQIGAARLSPIDMAEVTRVRAAIAGESDPTVSSIERAARAFYEGDGDLRMHVESALESVRKQGFSNKADPYSARWLNDLAFLAFGTLGVGAYDEVTGLIKDGERLPLTAATQALRLAGSGNTDAAFDRIAEARAALAEGEELTVVWMYGPQMLIEGRNAPAIDDIQAQVPLTEILDVYEAAVKALANGEPIEDALRSLPSLPSWASDLLSG